MNKIGITTTVPIEVLLAAGYQPVDLNNVFITDPNPERLVSIAEKAAILDMLQRTRHPKYNRQALV